MQFLKTLGKILKTGGQAAIPYVIAANPVVGTIAQIVFGAVLKAETTNKPGIEKREMADAETVPAALKMMELQFGDNPVEIDEFRRGLSLIREGVVVVLNSIRTRMAKVQSTP
jgi:hypothetical protein